MRYRCQYRDHLGVVTRAYGGKVVHRTKWITSPNARFDTEEAAVEYCGKLAAFGLRQWRVMFGKRKVREWL